MPIYEYLCQDGHRFEVVQRFSDEPVTLCEVCGKPVQRVLFAPAVHYKGKGFYATDYGRKGADGAGRLGLVRVEDGARRRARSRSSESKLRLEELGLQELGLEELRVETRTPRARAATARRRAKLQARRLGQR